MMKLNKPKHSFEDALDECGLGITGNSLLKKNLGKNKPHLTPLENIYSGAAQSGKLYTILTLEAGNSNCLLTKSELNKMYDQYFVPEGKPAREIYDAIKNAAKEKCPFCGGIGTPATLDHFLPKAHFPQLSVLPLNLVPACRDCNMEGKGQAYAQTAEEQIIQPYLDDDRFFKEQWIFARYHTDNSDEPGSFEYYVDPPADWSETDRSRVQKHFTDFNIGKRYSIQAASNLKTALSQIERLKQSGLQREVIIQYLIDPAIQEALFINHWQRSMYQALRDYLNSLGQTLIKANSSNKCITD